jgi:hypothetical protein
MRRRLGRGEVGECLFGTAWRFSQTKYMVTTAKGIPAMMPIIPHSSEIWLATIITSLIVEPPRPQTPFLSILSVTRSQNFVMAH